MMLALNSALVVAFACPLLGLIAVLRFFGAGKLSSKQAEASERAKRTVN
jgi:hypothetical protein